MNRFSKVGVGIGSAFPRVTGGGVREMNSSELFTWGGRGVTQTTSPELLTLGGAEVGTDRLLGASHLSMSYNRFLSRIRRKMHFSSPDT